jgi:hypothetical protein
MMAGPAEDGGGRRRAPAKDSPPAAVQLPEPSGQTLPALADDADLRRRVGSAIVELRGLPVILDTDVAAFFGRTVREVNQQRKRMGDRFPPHFAFELTAAEWAGLKSQSGISSGHGGRRTAPWAYSEHGFTMLSMGLRGDRAARIAQVVIDTFVSHRRGTLPAHRTLPASATAGQRGALLQQIYGSMERLLGMELPTGSTAGSELKQVTASAIGRIKALLDAPAISNARVSAEIARIEAETARLYAEVGRTEAEAANLWQDAFAKRLANLARLREMAAQLERDDVLALLDQSFDAGSGALQSQTVTASPADTALPAIPPPSLR